MSTVIRAVGLMKLNPNQWELRLVDLQEMKEYFWMTILRKLLFVTMLLIKHTNMATFSPIRYLLFSYQNISKFNSTLTEQYVQVFLDLVSDLNLKEQLLSYFCSFSTPSFKRTDCTICCLCAFSWFLESSLMLLFKSSSYRRETLIFEVLQIWMMVLVESKGTMDIYYQVVWWLNLMQ